MRAGKGIMAVIQVRGGSDLFGSNVEVVQSVVIVETLEGRLW